MPVKKTLLKSKGKSSKFPIFNLFKTNKKIREIHLDKFYDN